MTTKEEAGVADSLHHRATLKAWRCPTAIYQCDLPNVRHSYQIEPGLTGGRAKLLCLKLGPEGPLKRNNLIDSDIYIRAIPLPDDVCSHTFANDPEHPDVFVILVNSALDETTRRQIAWMAAFRDAARRMIPERRSFLREVKPALIAPKVRATSARSAMQLSRDELRGWVRGVVAHVQRVFQWTQKELGDEFGVSQATFSRWYSAWTEGSASPDHDQVRLLKSLYLRACGRLLGFDSLCHRSSYPTDCVSPVSATVDCLSEVLYPMSDCPTHHERAGSVDADLHVRSGVMSPAARAHCFGNRQTGSDVFIVMVNGEVLSPAEQENAVWDEVSAHVTQASVGPVPPSRSILRIR